MKTMYRGVFLAVFGAAAGLVGVAGCSSDGSGGGSGGGGGSLGAPCSVTGVTGTIPGVHIDVGSDRCIYHSGEAAVFTYTVTTDASVPPINVMASAGCGSCSPPSPDPLSFVSFSINGTSKGGQDQGYCLCDVGCCQPDQAAMITVLAATESGTINWSGRNWSGPSDTNNPEGAPFAPGSYGVNVTFDGRGQGSVTATLPIEIVP